MRYKCYCLSFPNGFHVGENSLDENEMTIPADTLFSALFQEALLFGKSDILLLQYSCLDNPMDRGAL